MDQVFFLGREPSYRSRVYLLDFFPYVKISQKVLRSATGTTHPRQLYFECLLTQTPIVRFLEMDGLVGTRD